MGGPRQYLALTCPWFQLGAERCRALTKSCTPCASQVRSASWTERASAAALNATAYAQAQNLDSDLKALLDEVIRRVQEKATYLDTLRAPSSHSWSLGVRRKIVDRELQLGRQSLETAISILNNLSSSNDAIQSADDMAYRLLRTTSFGMTGTAVSSAPGQLPNLTPFVERRMDFERLCSPHFDTWQGEYHPGGLPEIHIVVAIKNFRSYTKDGPGKLAKLLSPEWRTWCELKGRNILPFLGLASPNGDFASSLCLISPWMENGNIVDYLQTHPSADRGRLMRGIAGGLVYLHSHEPPIFHGGLKGTNILISPTEEPLLCDFGLSVLVEDALGSANVSYESVRWMSPERLNPEGFGLHIPETRVPAADMFAFGMVGYEVLAGQRPFEGSSAQYALFELVAGRRPHIPKHLEASAPTSDIVRIIRACWRQERTLRLHATTVVLELSVQRD